MKRKLKIDSIKLIKIVYIKKLKFLDLNHSLTQLN